MILGRRKVSSGFTFGNALLFDGTNDVVDFTQLGSVNTTWSYSGWFNSSVVNTTNQGLITDNNSNNYVRVNNAGSRVIMRLNSVNYFFTGFSFSNNTYYHIAISVNANSARVWVNDIESSAGTLTVASPTPSTTNFDQLGTDNGGNYLNGKYDEVGLWYSYALTDADVTALYNSGSGASCLDVSPGNLHFNYHFDESGTDTTAVDSSSAGNDGTLTNFPASGMWVAH